MRSIPVSTDVFAAIWASRREGEDDENAILSRILSVSTKKGRDGEGRAGGGIFLAQHDVTFPEGFVIYRTYKGRVYEAQVVGRQWRLSSDGQLYPSLHKLSWAVVEGRENAWQNWRYRDQDGTEWPISHLRPESSVRRRTNP